ncbi:MAG: ABC-2 type transport system ATP-binding protein [Verrucomicrobiales bacterium]|jgi:ABC-2 type transport system ATP-binding protein
MPTSPSSVISAVAVSKSWGTHQVFSDLTAEVPRGITGLLGSNGAGKTTMLGMLLGLHSPDGGSMRVLGEDPAHAGPELRMHIGYAPEHHNLPDDVAAQDLVRHIALVHGLPKREATTRSSDALWLVGLGEERARPVGTMSTGQRQRVKLAQAIAHGPSLILLDEPTDGLDPVQRDDMLALIRRIGTEFNIDVVLSSHLLDEVERIADNVVILSNGTVRAAGRIEDLRTGQGGMTAIVDEGVELVAASLKAAGFAVEVERNKLRVGTDEPIDELADAVRDAVAEHAVPLRRMEPVKQSLEDLFLDEVYGS